MPLLDATQPSLRATLAVVPPGRDLLEPSAAVQPRLSPLPGPSALAALDRPTSQSERMHSQPTERPSATESISLTLLYHSAPDPI